MKTLCCLTKLILVLVLCSFATGCVFPRRIIYITPAVTEWWRANSSPTPLPGDGSLKNFPTVLPTTGPVVLAEATLVPTRTPLTVIDLASPTQPITPTPYSITSTATPAALRPS